MYKHTHSSLEILYMEYALRFLIRGEEKEKDGSRESTFKEKHISNRGSLNCFLQILNTKQKNKTKQKKDRFFLLLLPPPLQMKLQLFTKVGPTASQAHRPPFYKRALLSYEKRCFLYSVRCCVLPIFQNFMIAIS